jgi:hypothetical protein
MKMRIHLRIAESPPNCPHTSFAMFIDGGFCGVLTMRNDEYERFENLLQDGDPDIVIEITRSTKVEP